MTVRRNISAWTAEGSNYPDFVSINTVDNSNEIEIIVRTTDNDLKRPVTGTIKLPLDMAYELFYPVCHKHWKEMDNV